jgi:hypothetical protein
VDAVSDDDEYKELFDAVIAVASAPPQAPGANVYAAKVPWSRIQRLRDALDACGVVWTEP